MHIVVAILTVRCELPWPQALADAAHPVAVGPGFVAPATGEGE